jgi:predicted transcriptional regulator
LAACNNGNFVKKKPLKTDLSAVETLGFEEKHMMNKTEQIENVTFQALAHSTRRTIIRLIHARNQGISYTELITELRMSTGKLNYHLEQLKGLIEKNSNQHYVLTPFGKKAIEHLNLIEQETSSEDEKYVKIAVLSQKTSLQPIVKTFLTISISLSAVLIAIWVFLFYVFLNEGAPLVVYVLMPVLIVVGFGLFGTLVYALVKSPSWVKRFEQRSFGEG